VTPLRDYGLVVRPHLAADAASLSDLPDAFCWTKYGTEAGEDVAGIVSRKEIERRRNGGVFLWGIGNGVGPSLVELIRTTRRPKVVFTPMLSKPAARDANPSALAVWHEAIGLDGQPTELPRHSLVTSRISQGGSAKSHFALVCRRAETLTDHWDSPGESVRFGPSQVVNLRSGSRVGASQVTSVVRRVAANAAASESRYRVAMIAELAPPYLVRLTACVPVPDALRSKTLMSPGELEAALDAMLKLRPDWGSTQGPQLSDEALPGLEVDDSRT